MRKTCLILTGLIISCLTYGQAIKIQGGTSVSRLDWNLDGFGSLYRELLIGHSFYAGIDYLDKQYVNLSSNIGVIRKGGTEKFKIVDRYGLTDKTKIEKVILDYLSINTKLDINYRIKETISPFICLGPRFDYLVSSSQHFEVLEKIDELKSISIGFILGGGLKYDISKIQLGLRTDYYLVAP